MTMNLQQLNPWNWFKHEETSKESTIPVKKSAENLPDNKQAMPATNSIFQLHREIDRLFDDAFRGFAFPASRSSLFNDSVFNKSVFDAKVNVASDDKAYHISLEAPGMTDKDISLELTHNVLTIRGEKKEESESKDKHYYRVERSYGSFQRVLSLPDDCDKNAIKAEMKNGLLEIVLPRMALPASEKKQIPINRM